MARYKHVDTYPNLIAVDPATQLLPGTFGHVLDRLFDRKSTAPAPMLATAMTTQPGYEEWQTQGERKEYAQHREPPLGDRLAVVGGQQPTKEAFSQEIPWRTEARNRANRRGAACSLGRAADDEPYGCAAQAACRGMFG